jgi:hypothetical protein
MLLRSAGIVGLAGIVMAIAAGNAFFSEPARTATAPVDAPSAAADATTGSGVIVTASAPATAPQASSEAQLGAAKPLALAQPPTAPATPTAPTAPVQPSPARANAPAIDTSLSSPELSFADPMRFQVAALSAIESNAAGAGGTNAHPAQRSSVWGKGAIECPRDWIKVSDTGPDGSRELHCRSSAALAPPPLPPSTDNADVMDNSDVAVADATQPAAGDGVDEALQSAAASHALELAGFVARVPLPRPDPPKVSTVSAVSTASSRSATSWPDKPPPNCGSKHAYWHFVDRAAGTKEWYCK